MDTDLPDPARNQSLDALIDITMLKLGDDQKKYSVGHLDAIRDRLGAMFDSMDSTGLQETAKRFSEYTGDNVKLVMSIISNGNRSGGRSIFRSDGVSTPITSGELRFAVEAIPTAIQFAPRQSLTIASSDRMMEDAGERFDMDTPREVLIGYGIDQTVRRNFGTDDPYPVEHLLWIGQHAERLVPYAHILGQHGSVERSICEEVMRVIPALSDGSL
jgi:hypothetical protein